MSSKALVLLSGGQDSATCLAIACDSGVESVQAVTFDYGQRHRIEIEKAQTLAGIAGVPIRVINARFIGELSQNALTNFDQEISQKPGELPSTFVPGRNLFFLSMAGVIARQAGIDRVYIGVCETDFSGYPDCRSAFIESAQRSINLAMETRITIATPLMYLTKTETVQLMAQQGKLAWYAETHTCYEGLIPACGRCPACQLRLQGFKEAGVVDPLPYQ